MELSHQLDILFSSLAACAKYCDACNDAGAGVGKCNANGCQSGHMYHTTTKRCDGSCDPNCNSCTTNGHAKCDSGQCKTDYLFNPTTMVCVAQATGE